MSRCVEVTTPARLHFGLCAFGGQGRQFGGVGMMVGGVGVQLRIGAAESFSVSGPASERVVTFARHFAEARQLEELPPCEITVRAAPAEHVGLGMGTQLGLAVAAGLGEWLGVDWRDAETLCRLSGRGCRSAIGTHGFLHGGLIHDLGKKPGDALGQLGDRALVPAEWRVVLCRPQVGCGLAGVSESQAMQSLPPVPADVTQQLETLIQTEILPAARAGVCQRFGEAVYQYGRRAGECFAPVQGGPFASSQIAALVERIRDHGIAGVGQSSWGPTVFAVCASEVGARELVERLRACPEAAHCQVEIVSANIDGAEISTQ